MFARGQFPVELFVLTQSQPDRTCGGDILLGQHYDFSLPSLDSRLGKGLYRTATGALSFSLIVSITMGIDSSCCQMSVKELDHYVKSFFGFRYVGVIKETMK